MSVATQQRVIRKIELKPESDDNMNMKSELKSLMWDVSGYHSNLILLGDDILKETGSFVPLMKDIFFGNDNLGTLKSLADRANLLVNEFEKLNLKLDAIKESGNLNQ